MPASQDKPASLIERIDAWLPQTQCTLCGYPRCRDYAEALADNTSNINRCPPGGDVTIRALSELLHIPPKPLDTRFGKHKQRTRAVIDETLCIGCRKCIDACPVDAILGAHKLMHTVITHECTGCELCLPPCPVDCITMVPVLTGNARSAFSPPPSPASSPRTPAGNSEGEGWPEYTRMETDHWRGRTEKRLQRLARKTRSRRAKASVATTPTSDREQIRAEIRAAVERVKARRRRSSGKNSSS